MAREEPTFLLLAQTSARSLSNARSTNPSTTSKRRKCRRSLTRWTSTLVPGFGTKPCCSSSTIPGLGSAKSCNSKYQTYVSMVPLKSTSWARARNIEVVPCGPKPSKLSAIISTAHTQRSVRPAALPQRPWLTRHTASVYDTSSANTHPKLKANAHPSLPRPSPPHPPPYHRHAFAAGR